MKIQSFDTAKEVLLIAEVGNNHEGSFTLAEELVGLAAAAGAQAVKFQTFKTDHFVRASDEARYKRMKGFELSEMDFSRLAATAKKAGLLFISTPLDLPSADFLNGIVDAFKIASGDNTFFPLLERVASFGKPTILSAGLASVEELRKSMKFMEGKSHRGFELALLHCVTGYPVPDDQANVSAMLTLKKELGCEIGYSDHTIGLEAACASVALGARIVEKHFTINKNYSDFRDHKLSADPIELAELSRRIKQISLLLGAGKKELQPCERDLLSAVRRSIVAVRDLDAGKNLQMSDLSWLRPAGGVEPGMESKILGKRLKRPLKRGDSIQLEHLE